MPSRSPSMSHSNGTRTPRRGSSARMRPATPTSQIPIADSHTAFSNHSIVIGGREVLQGHQVIDALRTMGLNPLEEHTDELVRTMDKDGDGFITKEEFTQFVEAEKQSKYSLKELQEMFRAFDVDNSGTLDHEEFRRIWQMTGHARVSETMLEDIMNIADSHFDGQIEYDQFAALMAPEYVGRIGRMSVRQRPKDDSAERKAAFLAGLMEEAGSDAKKAQAKRNRLDSDTTNMNAQLHSKEAGLNGGLGKVREAMQGDDWVNEGQFGLNQSPLLNGVCKSNFTGSVEDAEAVLQSQQEYETQYLEELARDRFEMKEKFHTMKYDKSQAEMRPEMQKIFQFRKFMAARTTIVPPGLMEFEADEKWETFDKEKEQRDVLRKKYLEGLGGQDFRSAGKNALRDEGPAHYLGAARRYYGGALCRDLDTDMWLTGKCLEVNGQEMECASLMKGKSVFEAFGIPTTTEDGTETRTVTCHAIIEGLTPAEVLSVNDKDKAIEICKEKNYSGFTISKGETQFFAERPEVIVQHFQNSPDPATRSTIVSKLEPKDAKVIDAYDAGVNGKAKPADPAETDDGMPDLWWRQEYAYKLGDNHRQEVLTSCTNPVGASEDLVRGHCVAESIKYKLHNAGNVDSGEEEMSAKNFAQIAREMESAYGATAADINATFQSLHKEQQSLKGRQEALERWKREKIEKDAREKKQLEEEEEKAWQRLVSDNESNLRTLESDFKNKKPKAKPPPQPAAAKSAPPPKKGCCG